MLRLRDHGNPADWLGYRTLLRVIDRQKVRTSAGKGEDTQVGSIGIFLDRGGIVICDIQISVVVKNHAIGRVIADTPEYAQVRPVGREFLDEITSVVRDIKLPAVSMTIPDGT